MILYTLYAQAETFTYFYVHTFEVRLLKVDSIYCLKHTKRTADIKGK